MKSMTVTKIRGSYVGSEYTLSSWGDRSKGTEFNLKMVFLLIHLILMKIQ